MSDSVPPLPSCLPQSQASVLGPGITDLFIQAIESGLVFAQFSQWFFASDRIESSLISTIVVFVTVVGLCASFRHFTVCLHVHYLFAFVKCAVRSMLCIGLVYVRTTLWRFRTCCFALAFCVGGTLLTLDLCLSCPQAGRIIFS